MLPEQTRLSPEKVEKFTEQMVAKVLARKPSDIKIPAKKADCAPPDSFGCIRNYPCGCEFKNPPCPDGFGCGRDHDCPSGFGGCRQSFTCTSDHRCGCGFTCHQEFTSV